MSPEVFVFSRAIASLFASDPNTAFMIFFSLFALYLLVVIAGGVIEAVDTWRRKRKA